VLLSAHGPGPSHGAWSWPAWCGALSCTGRARCHARGASRVTGARGARSMCVPSALHGCPAALTPHFVPPGHAHPPESPESLRMRHQASSTPESVLLTFIQRPLSISPSSGIHWHAAIRARGPLSCMYHARWQVPGGQLTHPRRLHFPRSNFCTYQDTGFVARRSRVMWGANLSSVKNRQKIGLSEFRWLTMRCMHTR
jgi:hypothetical protein